MPTPTNCQPCCTETLVTNVPGVEGDPGADGENGQNAYTTTTTDTTVPAIAAAVTVDVENSDWMVIGQIVVIDGPAHFTVTSKPSSIEAELTFLGYTGDVAAAAVIASGATVSPAGLQTVVALEYVSAYGSGVVYTLTNSTAYLAVGTNPPTITLPSTGTWLLTGTAIVTMAAWLSLIRTVTAKLRNTTAAADLTPIASFNLDDTIGAAATADACTLVIVGAITAGTAGDIIQLWGNRSAAASTSGDVNITATSITAVRIA